MSRGCRVLALQRRKKAGSHSETDLNQLAVRPFAYHRRQRTARRRYTFQVLQNSPNPFNPSTVVSYDVPASGGHVRLAIYDVGGRLVRVLVDKFQAAGAKRFAWNGRDGGRRRVASGVYFLRMRAPGFEQTLKMSLIQ